MKRIKKVSLKKLICYLLIFLYPSLAYAEGEIFRSYGMGMSCGAYVKEMANDNATKNIYSWWLAGFVTGTNIEKGRSTSTDNIAHEAWVLKYCKENPLEAFMTAASKLNKKLDDFSE